MLSVGGTVGIGGKKITERDQLPKGRWTVTMIELDFDKSPAAPAVLQDASAIAGLKNLAKLSLKGPFSTDHWGPIIGSLTALEELGVMGQEGGGLPPRTADLVSTWGGLKKLRRLTLWGINGWTPAHIEVLASLESLEFFHANTLASDRNDLTPTVLAGLAKAPNLKQLDLYLASMEWTEFPKGVVFPKLEVFLCIQGPDQLARSIPIWAEAFPKLNDLRISAETGLGNWKWEREHLTCLAELPERFSQPMTLTLKAGLNPEIFEALPILPKELKALHFTIMNMKGLTDDVLLRFAEQRQLKELNIGLESVKELTPEGIAAFKKARPDVRFTNALK